MICRMLGLAMAISNKIERRDKTDVLMNSFSTGEIFH
jgi:hypothetical protein